MSERITVGSKLPTGILLKEEDPTDVNKMADISGTEGRYVIIGVPGAFTPTCSNQVPGYIEAESEIFSRGIKAVYVVSVNDTFVMKAWKKHLTGGKESKVRFLADDTGKFVASLGLVLDAAPILGTIRSQRFAMIVNNGTVEHLAVEDDPSALTVTSVDAVLKVPSLGPSCGI